METNRITNLICGVATAAVVLSYASWGKKFIVPQETEYFSETETNKMSEWYNPNPYYYIYKYDSFIFEQVETVHQFVSTILENIQDLDPKFSDLVDKHFWELV